MNKMRQPVLQVNASLEPLRIISAKRAVKMLVKGVAAIELERDYDVRPDLRMPSVIRLCRYVRVPHFGKVLTRKNIYLRDDYRCQYCGKKFRGDELSWDHILPTSRGGLNEWENLVTCCKPCNHRKADRTPEEAEMPLLRRPLPRTVHTSRFVLRNLASSMPEWDRFLFHDSEGEKRLVHRG